jgi:hypothetical protein
MPNADADVGTAPPVASDTTSLTTFVGLNV